MKRKGDKNKDTWYLEMSACLCTHSPHNEIINFTSQVWREQALKLVYVCLTMQMFIWQKKNSKVENIKWQTC